MNRGRFSPENGKQKHTGRDPCDLMNEKAKDIPAGSYGMQCCFKVDIVADGVKHVLGAGGLIHIEPGEVHYVKNAYDEPVKMVSTLAPYQEVDKVNVDNPVY